MASHYMYIYCTMAPGADSTDESCQDQRPCLSNRHSTDESCPDQRTCLSSPAHSTDVSYQDQQPCLSSPRYQGSRHHGGQDDHLHPVLHIAQVDGVWEGRGIYSTWRGNQAPHAAIPRTTRGEFTYKQRSWYLLVYRCLYLNIHS